MLKNGRCCLLAYAIAGLECLVASVELQEFHARYFQSFRMEADERTSFLSFICPRVPSFGVVEGFRLSAINCNLLSEFNSCNDYILRNEPMKVYLRIRPFDLSRKNSSEAILTCPNKFTVIARPPDFDEARNAPRTFQRNVNRFTFSTVFDSSIGQSEVFESVASEKVRSFLEGLNGLIFAYGTTSSGKTYTLQGKPGYPGIIPRAFSLLFNSVKYCADPSFMPKDFSNVILLDQKAIENILAEKSTLCKLAKNIPEGCVLKSKTESQPLSSGDCDLNQFSGNTNVADTDTMKNSTFHHLDSVKDLRFTFWISYAEIYNEIFYDLLDPVQCSSILALSSSSNSRVASQCQQNCRNPFSVGNTSSAFNPTRRPALDLRTDKNGNVFIKGIRWFPIYSLQEALQLISVGRQCQKVAATRLNHSSSRSHSILTIKAVRVMDKENPRFARISTLRFCDLAGSERSEKAATGGQSLRIREAGNINSSLLTLGRCIECLRYNQAHPENPKLVPYRDSKLTRLFQGFFTGHGKACMIVNASPNPELFDETLHALRFSALAKQIIVESNPVMDATIIQPQKQDLSTKPEKYNNNYKIINNTICSQIITKSASTLKTPPTVINKLKNSKVVSETSSVDSFSPIESNTESILQKTPTNSDNENTELMLDHYSKEELISMVKELLDQLFEAKGEMVEQEARLRREMCENMNKQLIEFEMKLEEALKSRDNIIEEQCNLKMHYYLESVNKRQARLADNPKRLRPDESDLSSEDESSIIEDSVNKFNQTIGVLNETSKLLNVVKPCPQCAQQEFKFNSSMEALKQANDKIADLESELADQKDLTENLLKDADHNRLEISRLEFALTQQKLNDFQRSGKVDKNTVDIGVQTDIDEQQQLSSPIQLSISKFHNPSENQYFDSVGYNELDDSSIVINLPKLNNLQPEEGRRFFDPITDSPEQQYRLAKINNIQTPPTVIKVNEYTSQFKQVNSIDLDDKTDALREENQVLLSRLGQMRTCVQKALREKQEAELELTRLQNISEVNDVRESRVSQGLQSFLDHEARLEHQETMEQLKDQIYDLEEQFAHKHDAFVQIETAYKELKTEYDELSQRLIVQVNESHRLNEQLINRTHSHQLEIEKLKNTCDIKVCNLENKLQCVIDLNNELKSHIPNQDCGIQTNEQLIQHTSIYSQTIQSSFWKTEEFSAQVSCLDLGDSLATQTITESKTSTNDIGIQTDKTQQPIDDQNKSEVLVFKSTKCFDRLRSKHLGRLTLRLGSAKVPKVPSPVSSSMCASDSEVEFNSTIHVKDEKENICNLQEQDEADDEDTVSCTSEPGDYTKHSNPRRGKNNKNVNSEKSYSSAQFKRQTRSAAATRRLPPLAESTQLLPDSFFQEELDQVIEHTDAEFQKTERRNLRNLNLRQAPRRRR